MIRKLVKLVALLLLVLVAVPLLKYRTLSPCGMLERELASQATREVDDVSEEVRSRAAEYGEDAARIAEDIAEAAAAAQVKQMSTPECASELLKVAL